MICGLFKRQHATQLSSQYLSCLPDRKDSCPAPISCRVVVWTSVPGQLRLRFGEITIIIADSLITTQLVSSLHVMSLSLSHLRLSGIRSQPHLSSCPHIARSLSQSPKTLRRTISIDYLINLITPEFNRSILNDQIIDIAYHSQDSQCSSHRARP